MRQYTEKATVNRVAMHVCDSLGAIVCTGCTDGETFRDRPVRTYVEDTRQQIIDRYLTSDDDGTCTYCHSDAMFAVSQDVAYTVEYVECKVF